MNEHENACIVLDYVMEICRDSEKYKKKIIASDFKRPKSAPLICPQKVMIFYKVLP